MVRGGTARALCAGLLVAVCMQAQAGAQHGTPAEAQALVKKAIADIDREGRDKAFARFMDPADTEFHVKDMYVFVNDLAHGKSLAHINPRVVGHDMIDMKDADGQPYVRRRLAMARALGHGWQKYKYYDPVGHRIEDKLTYFELHDDYVVACGIYQSAW